MAAAAAEEERPKTGAFQVSLNRARLCIGCADGLEGRTSDVFVQLAFAEVGCSRESSDCPPVIAIAPRLPPLQCWFSTRAKSRGEEASAARCRPDDRDGVVADPVWLVVVDGGAEGMRQALRALTEAGSIRADLREAYSLIRDIGSGEFSTVYEACERAVLHAGGARRRSAGSGSDTRCAAKVIARGVEESVVLAEINYVLAVQHHPNIIRFHGLFCADGDDGVGSCVEAGDAADVGVGDVQGRASGWVALLQLCLRGDLHQELTTRGPYSERAAVPVVRALLSALAHVHGHGIVHRDVKPANILLAGDGQPVLCDFGISSFVSDAERMAKCCGSPGYVAPEVLQGAIYCAKVDVFGAGAVSFFLLSGCQAFPGLDVPQVLRKTIQCKLDFGWQFESVSMKTRKLLQQLMQRDPQLRPSSADSQNLFDAPDAEMPREVQKRQISCPVADSDDCEDKPCTQSFQFYEDDLSLTSHGTRAPVPPVGPRQGPSRLFGRKTLCSGSCDSAISVHTGSELGSGILGAAVQEPVLAPSRRFFWRPSTTSAVGITGPDGSMAVSGEPGGRCSFGLGVRQNQRRTFRLGRAVSNLKAEEPAPNVPDKGKTEDTSRPSLSERLWSSWRTETSTAAPSSASGSAAPSIPSSARPSWARPWCSGQSGADEFTDVARAEANASPDLLPPARISVPMKRSSRRSPPRSPSYYADGDGDEHGGFDICTELSCEVPVREDAVLNQMPATRTAFKQSSMSRRGSESDPLSCSVEQLRDAAQSVARSVPLSARRMVPPFTGIQESLVSTPSNQLVVNRRSSESDLLRDDTLLDDPAQAVMRQMPLSSCSVAPPITGNPANRMLPRRPKFRQVSGPSDP